VRVDFSEMRGLAPRGLDPAKPEFCVSFGVTGSGSCGQAVLGGEGVDGVLVGMTGSGWTGGQQAS